jgi:hypothetical protein
MFPLNSNSDIEIDLQDLILQSISNTADEQARLEIQQITETLVNRTDQINHSSYVTHALITHFHLFTQIKSMQCRNNRC